MKVKQKKGISLIVLVITIIVMIILAAAIILSLQSSGIISKANEARNSSDRANANDVVSMAFAEWTLDGKPGSFSEYAENKLKEAGFRISLNLGVDDDKSGSYEVTNDADIYAYPKIPKGFVASIYPGETKVSEGLVIYETTAANLKDKTKLQAMEAYNQFVWIPVNSINEFVRIDWENGVKGNEFTLYTSDYYKNDADNYSKEEAAEYIALTESVSKNGGFYIARYEAGLPMGITVDTANYGQIANQDLTIPVSKKMASVWNNIPWDSMWEMNQTICQYGSWNNPGCAKVAKRAYSKSDSVVSHLLYGAEWDSALKFISKMDSNYPLDSAGKGWYDADTDHSEKETGYDVDDKASNMICNIYDMAGNVCEWTMETHQMGGNLAGSYRILRGGDYGCSGASVPAANRALDLYHPAGYHYNAGFRLGLYLK